MQKSSRFMFRIYDIKNKKYITSGSGVNTELTFNINNPTINPYMSWTDVKCYDDSHIDKSNSHTVDESKYIIEQCTGYIAHDNKYLWESDVVIMYKLNDISRIDPIEGVVKYENGCYTVNNILLYNLQEIYQSPIDVLCTIHDEVLD